MLNKWQKEAWQVFHKPWLPCFWANGAFLLHKQQFSTPNTQYAIHMVLFTDKYPFSMQSRAKSATLFQMQLWDISYLVWNLFQTILCTILWGSNTFNFLTCIIRLLFLCLISSDYTEVDLYRGIHCRAHTVYRLACVLYNLCVLCNEKHCVYVPFTEIHPSQFFFFLREIITEKT